MANNSMPFQKHTIIVREDGSYPGDALVVDSYREDGTLLAHPLGGGWQLIIPVHEQGRFRAVTEEEMRLVYRPAEFSIEGVEGIFRGWSDGRVWNGWAMPRFEYVEAQRLASALGQQQVRYDFEGDAFISGEGEEQEVWPGEFIKLPSGETRKVYGIGAGSWVWEQE